MFRAAFLLCFAALLGAPLPGFAKMDNDRNLFQLPSPFDFYNESCENACLLQDEFDPFFNACPKCPDKYSPCNSCCYDGASSLKLSWHGCPGEVSLPSMADLESNCGDVFEGELSSGVKFVDCSCFDTITDVTSSSTFGCALFESFTLAALSEDTCTYDICLVSIRDGKIALDQSLPSVIGLDFTKELNSDDTETLTTYFDTSCASPIFPGYGKFPNTCPNRGLIDLEQDGVPRLPASIDHFSGTPPEHSHWFEFVDGTSVGFWPSAASSSPFFQPAFATCECISCAPIAASLEPTESPTQIPTEDSGTIDPGPGGITRTPTRRPSRESTKNPTSSPSRSPTPKGTIAPAPAPTRLPTSFTEAPVIKESDEPTRAPTISDTQGPTASPIAGNTELPTRAPIQLETQIPTEVPTKALDAIDTKAPTWKPSEKETTEPTLQPVASQTEEPTPRPIETQEPTPKPTEAETSEPSPSPVVSETSAPTETPVLTDTNPPVGDETSEPTMSEIRDTKTPTSAPTVVEGTLQPTPKPTDCDDHTPTTLAPSGVTDPGPANPPVVCEARGLADCNAKAVANCVTKGVDGVSDGSLCFYSQEATTDSALRHLSVIDEFSNYVRTAGPDRRKSLRKEKAWVRRQLAHHQNQAISIDDFISNVIQL